MREYLSADFHNDVISHTNDAAGANCFLEKIAFAIEAIENCDLVSIQENPRYESSILVQAGLLIDFLDGVSISLRDQMHLDQFLTVYKHFARSTFLDHLFKLRKLFRSMACRGRRGDITISVDVCWVDIILANISLVSVALASGMGPDELGTSDAHSLACQRRENYALAAAQLPESWSSLMLVIVSNNSSPAAKAVALHLLYTAYVLGNHLNDLDPWGVADADPGELANVCLHALQHTSANVFSVTDVAKCADVQKALHYSILISLFISSQQTVKREAQGWYLRPQTLNSISEAVGYVMTYDLDDSIAALPFPREHPSPGQTLLLKWGNVVPGCWRLWDDHRVANSEYIVYMTATWIYHFCPDNVSVIDEDPMQAYPDSTLCVLLQVIHYSTLYSGATIGSNDAPLPAPLVVILHKACRFICRIIETGTEIGRHMSNLCNCVLKLLLHIIGRDGPEESLDLFQVKQMALETLLCIDDDTFQRQLGCALSDTNVLQHAIENGTVSIPNFYAFLKNPAIARIKWLIGHLPTFFSFDDNGCLSTAKHIGKDLTFVRAILNFLIICWHKKYEGYVSHGTASTLLNLLAVLVTAPSSHNIIALKQLHNELWTALGVVAICPRIRICMSFERQQTLWDWTVRSKYKDLIIAGETFSFFVPEPMRVHDTLRYAESWDYLSSILLMIIEGDFVENEDLALLVSPSICGSLLILLQVDNAARRTIYGLLSTWQLNKSKGQFILSSPWTLSLVDQMQALLDHRKEHNAYLQTLQYQLMDTGTQLLHQVYE
ncbi:hypothetical protein AX17_000712 [Amanita inopinata Kibby_2008]|nr:hypothetical protein AX17_000712 [Amanita inopinata Kibby_2008]